MLNKKGASFGTIVAVFGSILIGVGIAWLIAQNWHEITSPLKIIILLGLTSGSYFVGTVLRVKDYPKIAKSLFVLGALLYTLSIFLIAQIFSTSTSIQGFAFLLLLSWAGVLASAYIFDSSASLVVSLAEIVIWLFVQFMAFSVNTSRYAGPSIGILALWLLSFGILLYGIGLLHRSRQHKFGSVYQWWTAFYFLAFAYVLSFQAFLPSLWSDKFTFSSTFLFFLVLLALALGFFISGAITALGKSAVQKKEIIGAVALAVILILGVASTSLAKDTVGSCSLRQCYDFREKNLCEAEKEINCKWENTYCREDYEECSLFKEKGTCEQNKCKWLNLTPPSCSYKDHYVDESATCFNYRDENSCATVKGCMWLYNYCQAERPCVKNFNNKNACLADTKCKWQAGDYFSWFGTKSKIPLALWLTWIFTNIVFLGIILSIIFYGTWQKLPKIVNLGILFFSLNIITRYIGFVMDFWGYTVLSVFFIIGGIILIAGGFYVEKWRRNLVVQARGAEEPKAAPAAKVSKSPEETIRYQEKEILRLNKENQYLRQQFARLKK